MSTAQIHYNSVQKHIFCKILCILVSIAFLVANSNIVYANADAADRHFDESRSKMDFSRIASEGYLKDSMDWIDSQNLGEKGMERFKYLWKSYKEDPKHGWSQFIARYGRTWIYDNAVGIYAELKFAKLEEIRGEKEGSEKHYENARKAVDSLVKLAKWEEEGGFKGLWHFAYDAHGNFVSPSGPMGANLWALNAIYAYIIQRGDRAHLNWINDKVKTFIFDQQVMDKKDPRHGLIQAGLRTNIGNLNSQMTWCNIEHNTEYLGTLRLAARANQGGNRDFLLELAKRHELCVKAIFKNFWQGDHFCTVITEKGEVNKLVSADTTSWTPFVLMPYMDMNDVWKCIQYLKNNFRIEVEEGERGNGWHWEQLPGVKRKIVIENEKVHFKKKVAGLFFFSSEHGENIPPKEIEKLEKMLHPEAMAYTSLLLIEFAKRTKNKEKRNDALDFLKELYEGIVAVKEAYGGKGTPYATLNVEDYSSTLESMTSTASGAILTMAMLGVDMDDFLGVVPPEGFTVDGKEPFINIE